MLNQSMGKSEFIFFIFLTLIYCFNNQLCCDVKSLDSQILFDINSDLIPEMTLTKEGLGIHGSPSSKLSIQGNAIISDKLAIGSNSSNSNLHIDGTVSFISNTYNSQSSSVGDYKFNLFNYSGNTKFYATLPSASSSDGSLLSFKNISSNANLIIYGSDNIDQYHDVSLPQYSSLKLVSSGSQWYVINETGSPEFGNETEGLDFMLDFNESSNDVSPNQYTGTLTGNTFDAATANGVIDSGLSFDGVDDILTFSDDENFDVQDEVTISFWVKPSSNVTSHGTQSAWTTLQNPDGVVDRYFSNMTFIQVGSNLKYVSYINTGNQVDEVKYGESDLQFNGLSWTDFNSHPSNTASTFRRSFASMMATNGSNIFLSMYALANSNTTFYTATTNLFFNNGDITWSLKEVPSGGDFRDAGDVDVVLVDETLHYISIQHQNGNETISIASGNSDGSGNLNWTQEFTEVDSVSSQDEYTSVGIDSDGEKLYYAFLGTEGGTGTLYLASSNLDFSGNTIDTLTAPTGVADDKPSHIDICLVGNKLHYAVAYGTNDNVHVLTAYSDLDGDNLSSWTSRGIVHNNVVAENSTGIIDLISNGANLQILTFSGDTTATNVQVSTLDLDGGPILSKPYSYNLHYTGGGLMFEWAGTPLSFGSLPNDSFSHVSITYDGTVTIFYINGEEVRRQTGSIDFFNSTSDLMIGGDGSRFFQGHLDEFRIYNRALDSSEVLELYQL